MRDQREKYMAQNGEEPMNRCEDWDSRMAEKFLAACCVAYDRGYTPIEEFLYLYDQWCAQQSMPTPSFIRIVLAMDMLGFHTYELHISSIGDHGKTGYHGIIPYDDPYWEA